MGGNRADVGLARMVKGSRKMSNTNGRDVLEQAVERAQFDNFSKQPRFKPVADRQAFAMRWLRLVKEMDLTEPPYGDARRAEWLLNFVRREPHLAGVVSSVVSIDKNRSWYLTGGRNQVRRFTSIAHAWENGKGWRWGMSLASQSFWNTDIGAIVEEGRAGAPTPPGSLFDDTKPPPLRALYHVDPTRCSLTNDPQFPLTYQPATGKPQQWTQNDFFRVASLPSVEERFNGLGFCAVSRVLEMAKIMVAIYQHSQEQLGVRMPNGLLLLQNVGEQQWQEALEAREATLDGLDRDWFGGVMALAHEGIEQMDAKLIALSQLPVGFDYRVFTDLLMFAYALAFGYDIREFWPASSGSLGTGTETETQHRKSGSKGGLDFVLGFQEQFQAELPDSLEFAFEQRDADGEMRDAELAKAQVEGIVRMYEAGLREGQPLITREEGRILLADLGRIKPEWTQAQEEAIATDTEEARMKRLREQLLDVPRIRRAIEYFPDEPIVRYAWPRDRELTIWESGAEAGKRKAFPVARVDSINWRVMGL